MDHRTNRICQAIFHYLEDVGDCEVTVSIYDDNIENVSKFQPIVVIDGQTHNNSRQLPMIKTFSDFFTKYAEDHMNDLRSRIDLDYNDYHELIFKISPKEKLIKIKGYGYFIEYSGYNFVKETPSFIVDLLDSENSSWFVLDFWAGHGDYGFMYSNIQGDTSPGLVSGIEKYFTDILDEKTSNHWYRDEGSEGSIHVNEKSIDVDLNWKNEVFKYTGFNKEIKI